MTRRRLVVDANVVISAFMADGMTRELLLDGPFELFAPEWLLEEVDRVLRRLIRQRGIPEGVYGGLMDQIVARIQLVPGPLLARHATTALNRCRGAGERDAPYVACALAVDAAVWTQDRRLSEESGVESFSTTRLWKATFG